MILLKILKTFKAKKNYIDFILNQINDFGIILKYCGLGWFWRWRNQRGDKKVDILPKEKNCADRMAKDFEDVLTKIIWGNFKNWGSFYILTLNRLIWFDYWKFDLIIYLTI